MRSPVSLMLARARLPRWCLPGDWPAEKGAPALADVRLGAGRIVSITPSEPPQADDAPRAPRWDLHGAPMLPGLVDAHTHLDKTFTLRRLGAIKPGLLGAIDAMMVDRRGWTPQDVRERASKALQWALEAGVVHLRTHCDWWEPQDPPLAWHVLRELAEDWADRLAIERVSLIPLNLFTDLADAQALARTMAGSGAGAKLGGFVHSSNWNPQALRHLFEAAQAHDLDVDLHVDEELNPAAEGLATTARLLRETGFEGRVVCGHACALAAQPEAQALATLDAVARVPITLVSLPVTNLLLQDASTGRTPRQRGITLVKEARERDIPLLIGSDNVQDPFCAVGSFDPVEAFAAGMLAAQLDAPFDRWSDTICRGHYLERGAGTMQMQMQMQAGDVADLVIFPAAEAHSWPARAQTRAVLRAGELIAGLLPAAWTTFHQPEHSE